MRSEDFEVSSDAKDKPHTERESLGFWDINELDAKCVGEEKLSAI